MESKEKFLKLLQRSNQLNIIGTSLHATDDVAFGSFLDFLVKIESNLHFSQKEKYIELINNFLDDIISPDDFVYEFISLYQKMNEKLGQLKRDESLELTELLEPNRKNLGRFLARVYGFCDSYNSNAEIDIVISDEKKLKELSQKLLFELEEN